MRKKLIEVALPLDAINTAAAREKSIRHGHPSTLHLWWARRPLAAARAVIFSQMVDDPSEYVDVLLSDAGKKRAAQRALKKRLVARASPAPAPPATGNGNIGAGEKPAATVEAEQRAPTLGDVAAAGWPPRRGPVRPSKTASSARQDGGRRAGRGRGPGHRPLPADARGADHGHPVEVDDATRFTEAFTHLRTGSPCRDRSGLLNVLLAEGINRTASSDGQFFPSAGRGEALNLVNARYGAEPGVKAYSHVSDRFSPFATQTIPDVVPVTPLRGW